MPLVGYVTLFIPVVLTAGAAGYFAIARHWIPAVMTWTWAPATAWFVIGVAIWYSGRDDLHAGNLAEDFLTVFIGAGLCRDVECAGQFVVTAPLVGSIAYSLVPKLTRSPNSTK